MQHYKINGKIIAIAPEEVKPLMDEIEELFSYIICLNNLSRDTDFKDLQSYNPKLWELYYLLRG